MTNKAKDIIVAIIILCIAIGCVYLYQAQKQKYENMLHFKADIKTRLDLMKTEDNER